ncbi:MAG: multicopper oxidase domain-containing protein [Gammaproteobacteria bacterium]|nr:multicopper oxidase domain-containing protein [Gammaproteobacteria bacterium]
MLANLPTLAFADNREFSLSVEEVLIKVAADLDYKVFAFNGQVPGPLIHVKEGDDLTVHVTNNTTLPHTVHWHGTLMTNNWRNDGVPGVTQENIAPGDTFTYKFKAEKVGSLWYHCHVNVNEHVGIRGMWGPMIVDPKTPTALEKSVTKDVIMMLSTWESGNANAYGSGGLFGEAEDYFSVNAKSFPNNQPIRVKKGDVVRLRFFGAGDGIHAMHPHGHDMQVTHKDGTRLPAPYEVDTLLIGPGERYDTIMKMNNPGLFIFHDHVDKQVTAKGKFPGGPITVFEYDEIERPAFYVWKDKDANFDPDFYYSASMKKGYGMFENPAFAGATASQRRKRQ